MEVVEALREVAKHCVEAASEVQEVAMEVVEAVMEVGLSLRHSAGALNVWHGA